MFEKLHAERFLFPLAAKSAAVLECGLMFLAEFVGVYFTNYSIILVFLIIYAKLRDNLTTATYRIWWNLISSRVKARIGGKEQREG